MDDSAHSWAQVPRPKESAHRKNCAKFEKIWRSNGAKSNEYQSVAGLACLMKFEYWTFSLGYKTFLNGTLVSDIVIDTSAAATDTIDYVAADNAGNVATSMRTVIVEAPTSTTQ
jgi:hypothetical protein